MEPPPARELMARIRSLPAGAPLLERLDDAPGVHLVGGGVRDLLMGGNPTDLDLVVDGDPAVVCERLGGQRRAHERFETSTVTADGYTYDLARARREIYAHPGALPEVAPASLEEDLLRRDFTVNAVAIALTGARAGSLTTAPGALDDLDRRLLRVLHDRSFVDDPTRVLRLARYAARLGFEIEPRTRRLAEAAVRDRALSTVSGSRIGAELRLLAGEPDPVASLLSLRNLGADSAIDPHFGLDDPGLARRALALLPPEGRGDRLVLAVAARGLPANELRSLLDLLAFEAGDREAIAEAATRASGVAAALEQARRPSEIASAISGAGAELVALAGALGPADQAREWLNRLRHVRLEINGDTLIAAGVPEGPRVGAGLRAALAAKLDGRASGHDQELAEAVGAASATE